MMKALRFHQFGKPQDVLTFEEIPFHASPQTGEVRVKVLASPINPADLNLIEGTYGRKPSLPMVAGIEGCGEVLESQHAGFVKGDRVIFLKSEGLWCEEVVVCGENLWRIPVEMDPLQAAMLKVNPATAWHLLHPANPLPKGSWVVQNAATSGVGRGVIGLAKHLGLRTINLVRRSDQVDELYALGADVVFLDDAEVVTNIRDRIGNEEIRLALNAVGGESALRLMNALTQGGELVTYGAMGRRPLTVPNGLLIFKNIQLRGFWLTPWIQQARREEIDRVYCEVSEALSQKKWQVPVDSVHALAHYESALHRLEAADRSGKVLFQIGEF